MWVWILVASLAAPGSGAKARKLTAGEVAEVAKQLKVAPESIDDGQAFEVQAAGKVTRFVALPNPQASTEYYLVRDGKVISHPSTDNTLSYAFTTGLNAVSFEDANGDGLWDVEVVEHHNGAGGAMADGSRPGLDYDAAVLLVQHPDGSFTDESAHLSWSCAKGGKEPNPLTIKDIRRAATCVSALKPAAQGVQ